ncbi:MAG: DUF4232 domain-containing protein [Acidimicrobiales bacterium]
MTLTAPVPPSGASRRRRPRAGTVLVLVAAVATACSSPKSAAPPTTSAPSSTAAAGHGTTTTTTPTTTTTQPGCSGTNYTLALYGTEGAAGTKEVTFTLRNNSSVTCTLFGYPGVALLGAGGALLATNSVRGGTESFTDMAPAEVTVAPGASAYFNIGYSDVTTGTESSCPTTTGIQVIPPDTTTELKAAGQFTVCNGGTVDISPVFAAGSTGSETTAPPSS